MKIRVSRSLRRDSRPDRCASPATSSIPDLIAEQVQPEKYPVHTPNLPPNLAVTFHEADGELVTADDMNHPKVGALRVSYRVIPARTASLTGVQHGQRLSLN